MGAPAAAGAVPAGSRTRAGALAAGCLAFAAVWVMNAPGRLPGTHSDGVEYTTAAASLARTGTLEIPVTHWSDPDDTTALSHYPPGFPALLAVPMALGLPEDTAVTAVLALGAAFSAAMAFVLAAGIGGLHAGVVASGLLLATPVFANLHLAVWSETAYLGIALLGLWTLIRWPDRPGTHGLVMAVGLAVRYVGVAGVATAVAFALGRGGSVSDRVRRALWAGGPGLVFLVVWRTWVRAGDEVIRSADLYAGAGTQLRDMVVLLVRWLAPVHLTRVVAPAVVLFVVFVGGVALLLGAWPGSAARARRVFLVFSLAYAGVVILSRAFLDPLIPFDARLFIPVLALASVAVGVAVAERSRRLPGRWPALLHLPLLIWAVAGVADIQETARVSGEEGRFYTHRAWETDPVANGAYAADDRYLYSNEAALIVHYGGRAAKRLPRAYEDLDAFAAAWRTRPGPILFKLPPNPVDPPIEVFLDGLPVREVGRSEHAAFLVPRDP